ncbi:MAG: rod shape-determining protein MreD [Pseudomonadota bacterium]|nr:rod shape-determining protein MreD [Pseudomonadota bacterium]
MDKHSNRGSFALYATFLAALVLQVVPLPLWIQQARPDIPLLVLIYWSMALPDRIGIIAAVVTGILVDALTFSLLGQHALSYAIPIYIVLIMHKRLRLMPMWQQALTILVILYIERLIAALILGITDGLLPDLLFWLPPLIGMFLWPWIFILLRELRQSFHIH